MVNFLFEPGWKQLLRQEFDQPYMQQLMRYLAQEGSAGKKIYPPFGEIFSAFNLTPLDKVKVVILGQDPYHGDGQAHGLCFSVRDGVKIPPSLVNIFKELEEDLGITAPAHGCLESWASQGVLLLNNVLTVEEGLAGSHHKQGWEQFTARIIELLNEQKEHLVFILWGTPAQKKAAKVDAQKHLILKSVHPSPLSVYRGFKGSKPFSKANAYLEQHQQTRIDWRLI
jgi:uracil-DNA glycosylase